MVTREKGRERKKERERGDTHICLTTLDARAKARAKKCIQNTLLKKRGRLQTYLTKAKKKK